MKPWIFWTGQVPEIERYDEYANAVEVKPRLLTQVRIVVVEPHKYVIEVEGIVDALGCQGWMDAHELGNVDPAMVLQACLLDLIARRNALGWIPRSEMPLAPAEPEVVAPAQIENAIDADDAEEELEDRVGKTAYEKRCRAKFDDAGVADEIRLNNARGRIISAFKTVGQTLRTSDIAAAAQCSNGTVSNYCGDYRAGGWLSQSGDGWTLLKPLPEAVPRNDNPPPAWQARKDLIRPEQPAPESSIDLKVNSTNGHAPINTTAPLVERVVDVLARGPQTFDKLAGLLVVGIKPLSTALADLASDGTVMLKSGHYHLDENV